MDTVSPVFARNLAVRISVTPAYLPPLTGGVELERQWIGNGDHCSAVRFDASMETGYIRSLQALSRPLRISVIQSSLKSKFYALTHTLFSSSNGSHHP